MLQFFQTSYLFIFILLIKLLIKLQPAHLVLI